MALETDTHYIGHSLLVRPTPTHSQHTLTIGPSAFSASARYGQRCLRQGSAQITSLYRLLAVTYLLARASNTTRRRRRAECHPFSHHTHTHTDRQELSRATSRELLSPPAFFKTVSCLSDGRLFVEGALWRGSGGGCVSGRERAGRVPGPGFAPSYTPMFGLAAATLLLLQPPCCWHYVTAGSPLLLLSPSLASIDRSPSAAARHPRL